MTPFVQQVDRLGPEAVGEENAEAFQNEESWPVEVATCRARELTLGGVEPRFGRKPVGYATRTVRPVALARQPDSAPVGSPGTVAVDQARR